jgi:hypothetical protein
MPSIPYVSSLVTNKERLCYVRAQTSALLSGSNENVYSCLVANGEGPRAFAVSIGSTAVTLNNNRFFRRPPATRGS